MLAQLHAGFQALFVEEAGAAEAKIPVFTIAYGTDDATIVVDGKTMDAGADTAAIAQVAEATFPGQLRLQW